MRFRAFSRQQRRVLTWWCSAEGQSREAVICDGAVRSGKTLCMGLAFFLWATACFDGMAFGLCGKTITALRRNLLREVLPALGELGFQWREQASQNRLTVRLGGKENTFYLFGGRDEGSAALIQGITLAGVLLDEAALMPRSFVEQACARCSVPGSRMWFSCNPEHPEHWFYKEWILKAEERRALYLHFTMEDNPALTPQVRERYARSFSGAFYRRFVLGEWVAAQGRVYDFFDESWARPVPVGGMERWCISCDYGTVNPTSLGLWGCGAECGTGCRSPTMTPGPRGGREPTESTPTPWSGWRGDGPSGRWWPTRRRPALSRPCAGGDGGWKRPTTTCWPVSEPPPNCCGGGGW